MKKKIFYLLVIIISLLILPKSINYIYDRVEVIIETKVLTSFYNVINVDAKYEYITNVVEKYFNDFWNEIKAFFMWLYKVLLSKDAMIIYIWVVQSIMFIIIIFKLWTSGSNYKYKTSKMAKILIFLMERLRWFISEFKMFYIENKKNIHRILFFVSGVGIVFFFELLIFFY